MEGGPKEGFLEEVIWKLKHQGHADNARGTARGRHGKGKCESLLETCGRGEIPLEADDNGDNFLEVSK